jgi:transglutaminase-like putative cysteine protease
MPEFVQPSKSISWLANAQQVPADQYAPKLYHVPQWGGWSDRKKLQSLREMAEQYGRDPAFRQFVIHSVLGGVGERDMPARAAAILRWVQANIKYSYEANELIQSPAYTLRVKIGDCDDMAILLGAMATTINLPWRFVLAGKDRSGRGYRASEGKRFPWGVTFHHIYVEFGWPAFKPTTWASAEPTIKGAPLGYDVVLHGPLDKSRGSQMAELAGWGAVEQAPPVTAPDAKSPEELGVRSISSAGKSILAWIPWKDVAVGAVQGVLTAVILQAILKRRH